MGKNLTQLRADLRTDLSDSGSTWSNAEVDRCVERAISDLSRFLPRQRIWEKWFNFTVTDESFTAPADTDADRIVDAQDLTGYSAGDMIAVTAQPDVPRHITATLTDANNSVTLLTIKVKGTDQDDKAVEELFHLSLATKTATGKKIFKSVDQVEVDQIDGVSINSADTLDLGIGAYTDTWIYLANKPIRWHSDENVDNGASTSYDRDDDFIIDYLNGRFKCVSGGDMTAGQTVNIDYTIDRVTVDMSELTDFIRIEGAEYPVGQIPQSIASVNVWGDLITVEGWGQSEQQEMAEDYSLVVKYYARHEQPTLWHPGTVPEFLEDTVLLIAGAYALYIFASKHKIQAGTDLTSARTQLAAANTAHTALGTALTNMKKYLDDNSAADAAGILQDITDDVANLRTAIKTALDAAQAYLAEVDTTDLQGAEAVWATYASSPNYLNGGTEPDVLGYLTTGDGLLNSVTIGAEGEETPREYRGFAQTTRDALIGAFENRRNDWIRQGNVRVNAGLGFTQEAAQRLSNLRTYIEQAAGYSEIAGVFAREAEARVAEVTQYVAEATGYLNSANQEVALGKAFREEADNRRNEVYAIWRDRQQYIGDPTSVAVRQLPRNQYQ